MNPQTGSETEDVYKRQALHGKTAKQPVSRRACRAIIGAGANDSFDKQEDNYANIYAGKHTYTGKNTFHRKLRYSRRTCLLYTSRCV